MSKRPWVPALCAGVISIWPGGVAHASGDVDQPRVAIEPRIRATTQSDIRIESNLVLLPVNVTDQQNRLVTGLGSGDFRIFDGPHEQTVTNLSNEDSPISIGVVFDASGSMVSKMAKAREAVAEFLRNANPADEFFLVNFNDRAELIVPFTENAGDVESRLTFAEAHGRTALLDGVYLALNYLKHAKNSRKALLVISDGGENDSRYTQSELRRTLRESDVWIYAIGIYAPGQAIFAEEERGGPKLLSEIAQETGGHHVAIESARELPTAAAQIGRELRNQYVLAYSPSSVERDGKYHRVQVKLVGRRDLRLSWRPGYFAAEP